MTTRDLPNSLQVGDQPRLAGVESLPAVRRPVVQCPEHRLTGPWADLARIAVLPACDSFALIAAAVLAAPGWPGAGYVVAVLVLLNARGQHRMRICLRVSDEVPRMVACAALPLPMLVFWLPSAGDLARLGLASAGLLVTARASVYVALRADRQDGRLAELALIVGANTLGADLADLLLKHPEFGLLPVGFVDSLPPGSCVLPLLGGLPHIPEVISRHGVRRVIVCLSGDSDAALVSILRAWGPLRAEVYVVPRMHELAAAVPRHYLDEVWGIPLVPLRRCGLGWSGQLAKRMFDIVVGSLLLVFLAPVLVALMVAVLVSCGRPVLFRQLRVTGSGRAVRIAKLRTVTSPGPATQWTVPPDQCTRLGRWLRATHLDELPQLINVVRGEMSLVGPRPERPYFASRFAKAVPRYDDRHRALGGMTGWAQVHGLTGDTSIAERVRFDNHYIENWSLWLDVVILARTLAKPLSGARRANRL